MRVPKVLFISVLVACMCVGAFHRRAYTQTRPDQSDTAIEPGIAATLQAIEQADAQPDGGARVKALIDSLPLDPQRIYFIGPHAFVYKRGNIRTVVQTDDAMQMGILRSQLSEQIRNAQPTTIMTARPLTDGQFTRALKELAIGPDSSPMVKVQSVHSATTPAAGSDADHMTQIIADYLDQHGEQLVEELAKRGLLDDYLKKYIDQHAEEFVAKAIETISKRRRGEAATRPAQNNQPSLQDRLAKRVEVPLDGAPTLGRDDAPVTIVMFGDLECPYCARVIPTLGALRRKYGDKIRLAFRHNPLPMHGQAEPAARAAIAAQRQGKFWAMHDALFKDQAGFNQAHYLEIARAIGLNIEQFERDEFDPATQAIIEQDKVFARSHGATGAPAFFINGVLLAGAKPIDRFEELIDYFLAHPDEAK
jgi:protein-disulfide isomerase